jgi:transposase
MSSIAVKILIGFVLIVGAAAGGYWKGHHDETMVFDVYKQEQAANAEKQVASNQHAVAAITASEAAALRATASTLQESNDELTKRRDALVADRAQLVSQLRTRLAGTGGRAAQLSSAPAAAGGSHATGDGALSVGLEQLVEFNGREFYEADLYADQLIAAQQVIVQDRQICNGSLPGVSQ